MFTGIVTAVGRIVESRATSADQALDLHLVIETPRGYLDGVTLGDSVALNGACMTVTTLQAANCRFGVDVSAFPRLLQAEAACKAVQAFADAAPDKQHDAE